MIRVLIVDDSALVRTLLREVLDSAPDIEVVGHASDPYFARDKFKKLKPDVITLDVEMPRMDGLTFLEKLMRYQPTPVVMISSQTKRGAAATLRALSLGAIDFVAKPDTGDGSLVKLREEIIEKVRNAAKANIENLPKCCSGQSKRNDHQDAPDSDHGRVHIDKVLSRSTLGVAGNEPVIVIGASTGGTIALEYLLGGLPKTCPGIVIVQHMPAGFTGPFAERLNAICDMEVLEAKDKMTVRQGRAIVAQGGAHLLLQRGNGEYFVSVKDGPPVNRHKPSVDVLFRSAANSAGISALGIILTGMGDDGARGIMDLHQAGALTLAQDESSCVVFGMPKAAIELGGVSKVLSLEAMRPSILRYA